MSESRPSSSPVPQKTTSRRYWIGGLILLGAMVFGVELEQKMFQPEPLPDIFGVWTEQEVAPYAADSFEVRPSGIFVDGRQVNTHYQWDGHVLEYTLGEQTYTYTFLADQLIRQRPAHYTSAFSRQALMLRHTL